MFAVLLPIFNTLTALAWPAVISIGIFKLASGRSQSSPQAVTPHQTSSIEYAAIGMIILVGLYALKMLKDIVK